MDGVFDAIFPIKTLKIPFLSTERVWCDAVDPFRINERVKVMPFGDLEQRDGKLEVVSSSSIFIEKEGGINGSNCGLRRGSKCGNRNYLKYGKFIGNTEKQNGSEI